MEWRSLPIRAAVEREVPIDPLVPTRNELRGILGVTGVARCNYDCSRLITGINGVFAYSFVRFDTFRNSMKGVEGILFLCS